jgi:hypothetical protein
MKRDEVCRAQHMPRLTIVPAHPQPRGLHSMVFGLLVEHMILSKLDPKSDFDWYPHAYAGATGFAFALALSIIGAWFIH